MAIEKSGSKWKNIYAELKGGIQTTSMRRRFSLMSLQIIWTISQGNEKLYCFMCVSISCAIACEKQPRISCGCPRLPPLTPPPEIRGCFSQASCANEHVQFVQMWIIQHYSVSTDIASFQCLAVISLKLALKVEDISKPWGVPNILSGYPLFPLPHQQIRSVRSIYRVLAIYLPIGGITLFPISNGSRHNIDG
jgi:hypothetical protein